MEAWVVFRDNIGGNKSVAAIFKSEDEIERFLRSYENLGGFKRFECDVYGPKPEKLDSNVVLVGTNTLMFFKRVMQRLYGYSGKNKIGWLVFKDIKSLCKDYGQRWFYDGGDGLVGVSYGDEYHWYIFSEKYNGYIKSGETRGRGSARLVRVSNVLRRKETKMKIAREILRLAYDVVTPAIPANLNQMSLNDIGRLIQRNWNPIGYAAKPYVDAMRNIDSNGMFFADDWQTIVAYALSNMNTWRGGDFAKAVKNELNRRLKVKRMNG